MIFHGHVSEDEKKCLLQRAWVFVTASMKEGWGLVAVEANACGTPAVAFNVPGLCEAIDNPHSGYLVENEEEFVQAVVQLMQDSSLRSDMSYRAVEHARDFCWDDTAAQTFDILTKAL